MFRFSLMILTIFTQVSQSWSVTETKDLYSYHQYPGYQQYPYLPYSSTPYSPPVPSAPQPIHINQPVLAPAQIRFNNLIYNSSVSGFRTLIEENHRNSRPDVYKKMDAHLTELERDQSIANWVGLGGLIFAIGYMTLAPVPAKRSWCASYSTFDGQCIYDNNNEREISDARYKNIMIGFAIWGISFIYSTYKDPGRREIMDLINKHNRLVPDQPIQMNLGFWLSPKSEPGLSLAVQF